MLRQSGMPPLAVQRLDDFRPAGAGTNRRTAGQRVWPLLIGGGPALSMNPEPLAPFFDAIAIGEAEELLPGLIDLLVDGIGGDPGPSAGRAGCPARGLRAESPGRRTGWRPVLQARRTALGARPVGVGAGLLSLLARRRVRQPSPGRDCPRVRSRLPILSGRLCLSTAPREQPFTRILAWARGGAGAAVADLRPRRSGRHAAADHRSGLGSRFRPFADR